MWLGILGRGPGYEDVLASAEDDGGFKVWRERAECLSLRMKAPTSRTSL